MLAFVGSHSYQEIRCHLPITYKYLWYLSRHWLLIWTIQNDGENLKMTETMADGYSSESTQSELANEYQQEKVKIVLKLWTKVAAALEGQKLVISIAPPAY